MRRETINQVKDFGNLILFGFPENTPKAYWRHLKKLKPSVNLGGGAIFFPISSNYDKSAYENAKEAEKIIKSKGGWVKSFKLSEGLYVPREELPTILPM